MRHLLRACVPVCLRQRGEVIADAARLIDVDRPVEAPCRLARELLDGTPLLCFDCP